MNRNFLKTLEKLTLSDYDGSGLSPIVLKKTTLITRQSIASNDGTGDKKHNVKFENLTPVKSTVLKSAKAVKFSESTRFSKPTKSKEVPPIDKVLQVESESSDESVSSTASLQSPLKPRHKTWTAKDKRDLEAAFFSFNPCTDKDWKHLVEALPIEWTIEEAKQQIKKMKLKPLVQVNTGKASKTDIAKLQKLTPNGTLPNKGTIKREELEEEVMQQLYVKRVENKELSDSSLDDSDDVFIREAMQNYALENPHPNAASAKYPTPSRRVYFPQTIVACRRPSSLGAINAIGDDFSIPDRGNMKYRLKFRAQQFGYRRPATKAVKCHGDTEFLDTNASPENADDSNE